MKGIVITTPNYEISVQDYGEPLHQTVGKTVGGYIEIVHPQGLPEPYCMIVNEEGKLIGLPTNGVGCDLYGTQFHGDRIVGNIVIMKEGFRDGEPDIVGLESEEVEELMAYLKKRYEEDEE